MIRALPVLFLASAVAAEPRFEDRSFGLPDHVYDGGWEHFVGGGIAVFDCNRDGLPDIFAAGGENPAKLFVNQGDFTFIPVEFPAITGVTGAYPLDINSDGTLDLFIMRVGQNELQMGAGDCRFSRGSELPLRDDWTTAFSAWWDDQGLVMAIGNYVDRSDPDGPFEACDDNYLLRAGSGDYFATPLTPGYCPLSMLAANDARGRPTLRISNDRHYYVRGGHEQMWDIADGHFLGPEDGWNNVSLWGMGIASRDLTGDGLDEVMLTSMGDQLMQLANPDGTYGAAPYSIGTYAQRPHIGDDGRPSTGWHAEFADVDNDTQPDLFIAKGNVDQMPGLATRDPNNLLMQNEDGTFVEAAATAGIATTDRSRGAAFADFDNDGRLDLVVMNRRAPMELYRNITEDTGNWLRVDMSQMDVNTFGIGATIIVRYGADSAGIQVQQKVVGGGHAGGSALPLHFGLGDAESAVITVRWPDGSVSGHESPANQTLIISR
ncbi:CRTAC1 family protein [Cognatiyoonia sp. IB215446]|uniref:CRTAC1 family protein n=1 Tax=Cognatiyoonia sp. IB215446 TaxID=3097355 RepID=UPI002A0BD2D8|nr:CRTAC1 family protein [Cognatiyoonia sp. IB215446]MDX8349453.1 CRTAC1 family protein [Cognatiyoonia sp. IB215446]